jgi:ubiquinone biosynthesis protein UbiJ
MNSVEYTLQVPWKRFVNRVLRDDEQARARLKRFAGSTAQFDCGPVRVRLAVTAGGEVDVASVAAAPDVRAEIPVHLLGRLADRDEAAFREVKFDGDSEFAQEIAWLARNLAWNVEKDLANAFGDDVARDLVEAARSARAALRAWGGAAAENLGAKFTDRFTQNTPLLVARAEAEAFLAAIDALRDDVARLEKRVESLRRETAGAR